MIKRIFDLVVSSLALLVASPAMAIIAVLIKLDSKGPIFFRQTRVGKEGEPFEILKFRSMVAGAAQIGPYYTSQGDSRITRVGRLLRKTSLDELPQLINVLRGEMSVVGPRPNVYAQKDQYSEQEWMLRNRVKPGITGLAQATKRSQATPAERNSLDLQYVQRQSVQHGSLGYDLWIILLTLRQMLTVGGN